jgi:hypothetical protein
LRDKFCEWIIRKVFTPEVFTEISNLVARGFSAAEIADTIGCTLNSLRVTCSHHGISLRSQGRLAVKLSGDIAALFQREAEKHGISPATFAASLLETIVRDNLYNAVIDQDIGGVRGRRNRTERVRAVRIPTKPATCSDAKPAASSDAKPATSSDAKSDAVPT